MWTKNEDHEKSFLTRLGENITRLRKEKSLTQVQLSEKCEIEKSNLIRIEKGRTNPTSLTLLRISKALEIAIAALFFGL